MNVLGDIAVVLCLWAWALCLACWFVWRGWTDTLALGQLIALTLIAALGWLLCLVGYPPAPHDAAPLEMLAMHPVLGPALWICGGVGGCAALFALKRLRLKRLGGLTAPGLLGLVVVACALGCAWIWALGPALHPDEGLYHLSLPLQYLQFGGYLPIEGHGNSGFFALGDMLGWWCMAAGAPGAARQMQLLVVVVGWTALIAQAAPQMRGRIIWAWAMWLCVPVVLWELGSAYVDATEAVLTLVGLSCLTRWWEATGPRQDAHLAQAAWLLGAAAACRQLALCALPALGLVVLLRLRGEAQEASGRTLHPARAAIAFAACAVLPMMFALHNTWVFGNPVFPFASDFFVGAARLKPSQLQVLDQFLAQHGPMQGEASRTGLDALWHLPWALLCDAAFGSPKFDGVIGPLPLVAAGIGVWRFFGGQTRASVHAPGRGGAELLLGFAGLRGLVWLSTSWQARFLIMPLGALSLWACQSWPAASGPRVGHTAWNKGLRLAAAAMLLAALGSLKGHTPIWDGRYLQAPEARYQARLAQLPQSGLCAVAAEHNPAARVMLVWTQRLACFCPSALWSDSYDEAATLVAWLEAPEGPSIAARLHQAQITHLLVDEAALMQMPDAMDAAERHRWHGLQARWQTVVQQDLRLEAAQGAVRLYAVRAL